MKSNFFEEVTSTVKTPSINAAHADMMSKYKIPKWAKFNCPYCKNEMASTSIRSISLRFNARNIGDVCVEFLCDKCETGNTMYFSRAVSDMEGFVDLINPNISEYTAPTTEPISEEEMYKQKYHNVVIKTMIPKQET